jgi:hypothetical protein
VYVIRSGFLSVAGIGGSSRTLASEKNSASSSMAVLSRGSGFAHSLMVFRMFFARVCIALYARFRRSGSGTLSAERLSCLGLSSCLRRALPP